ncbi:hypothetical protein ANASTE_01173 [Anaerofustis stercorihominis DSM 17244]|uniref:Uncharacterized protein n=1 Tax=Anaerofustis stercorihominis DSM 17244 TaxID=445971 RepID=B1CB23_9FIRM|nr:hypothetical protein ANASTE_01173 [Anaerofustis stercorihominis DSM 17244]
MDVTLFENITFSLTVFDLLNIYYHKVRYIASIYLVNELYFITYIIIICKNKKYVNIINNNKVLPIYP